MEIGSGTQGYQTGGIIVRLERVLLRERPDLVVVYGDTNSTIAGALATAKLHIRIAHIEAGVRSFNRFMPEELNRIVTDQLADLHFCPSRTAVRNLAAEGIKEGVYFVGDVMYDSILFNIKKTVHSNIMRRLKIQPKKYGIATVHRAENTDNEKRMVSIFETLDKIAGTVLPLLIPVHPRTRKRILDLGMKLSNMRLIDPISYWDMIKLEKNARVIFTDSGGMQKEAYYLKVPCVTLREDTEWVETVKAGWNRLAGWKEKGIYQALKIIKNRRPHPPQVYGNGLAAEKILSYILK